MLAQARYNRLLKKRFQEKDCRIVVWRDLSINYSASTNPFSYIREKESFPINIDLEFFPNKSDVAKLPNNEIIRYDVIETVDSDKNIIKAHDTIKALYIDPSKKIFPTVDIWFVQAGWCFYNSKQYYNALRAFLNSYRFGEKNEIIVRNIAMCLAEMGDFKNASIWYIRSAEMFYQKNKMFEAADCFERAGLIWEAIELQDDRPSLITVSDFYNSTSCFQKAKAIFTTIGEYDEASRCFVLERDSHSRWTWSKTRKTGMYLMRFIWLYGESPVYAFRTIILTWLIFAIGFMFSGFKTDGKSINYDIAFNFNTSCITDFASSLYFSVVTMSTLGYGDYSPNSTISKIFAGLEAFSGICLVAMFLVAIQRRFVGR